MHTPTTASLRRAVQFLVLVILLCGSVNSAPAQVTADQYAAAVRSIADSASRIFPAKDLAASIQQLARLHMFTANWQSIQPPVVLAGVHARVLEGMKARAEIIAEWRPNDSDDVMRRNIVALMQIGAEYGMARTTVSQLLKPEGVALTPLPWTR